MVVLFCVVYLSCHWHRLPVLLCHGVAALPVCELPSSSYPLPQLPDRSCYSNLHKGPAVILQQLAPRCCYSAAIGVTLPRRSCSCGQRVHSTHAGVKLASYFFYWNFKGHRRTIIISLFSFIECSVAKPIFSDWSRSRILGQLRRAVTDR